MLNVDNQKEIYLDIFDTIISRKTHPENIKRIWANNINQIYNLEVDDKAFYEKRRTFEAKLCDSNNLQSNELEFRYIDLIQELYAAYDIKESYDRFYNQCLATELSIEKSYCYINDDIYKLIISNSAKKIIAISDFYLPKDALVELLNHFNVMQYIDEVYVSNELMASKRSKRLYDNLLKDGIINTKGIMIGDNINSDYNNAKANNLDAIHLDRNNKYQLYDKIGNTSIEKIYKNIDAIVDGQFPFSNISLPLIIFTRNIISYMKKNNYDKVLFLSREGEFLKVIFDDYINDHHINNISSEYFIVSRKSTFLPSLNPDITKESFFNLFRQYINFSTYEFLNSLNFESAEIDKIQANLDFDIQTKIDDFPNSEYFSRLKSNPCFIEIYKNNVNIQKANFNQYIRKLSNNENRILICDVGWKGTIQDNIRNIIDDNIFLDGLYLGLVAPGNSNENNQKHGLLFDYRCDDNNFKLYNENKAIFEITLEASHGSASKYIKKDEIIVVETSENTEELKLFNSIINPMQIELRKTISQINEIIDIYAITNQQLLTLSYSKFKRTLFYPNVSELEFFSRIYHYENFGVFQESSFGSKEHWNIINISKNYVKLLKNPNAFLHNSFWVPHTLYVKNMNLARLLYSKYKLAKENE